MNIIKIQIFSVLLLAPVLAAFLSSCGSQSGGNPERFAQYGSAAPVFAGLTNGRHQAFKRLPNKKGLKWNDGAVARLRLTGVAYDNHRNCTLISPRHVLMASHHGRVPGEKVIFYDKNGQAHEARMTARKNLRGIDIAVGLLDREISIPHYRVLKPRADYATVLARQPALVTNNRGQIFVHSILSVIQGHVIFGPLDDLKTGLAGKLISGDSGNPSFLYQDGEMILIETHLNGGFGRGPFVSTPENFSGINRLMSEMGGGYQLSTVAWKGRPRS